MSTKHHVKPLKQPKQFKPTQDTTSGLNEKNVAPACSKAHKTTTCTMSAAPPSSRALPSEVATEGGVAWLCATTKLRSAFGLTSCGSRSSKRPFARRIAKNMCGSSCKTECHTQGGGLRGSSVQHKGSTGLERLKASAARSCSKVPRRNRPQRRRATDRVHTRGLRG